MASQQYERLWRFLESPLLWGAVAFLLVGVGYFVVAPLIFFCLAWGASVAAIYRAESFLGNWLKRGLCIGIAACIIGVLLGTLWYSLPKPKPEPSEAVLNAQLIELNQLEDFIGSKTEAQLREMFDFPNMLRFNILNAKEQLDPSEVKSDDWEATQKYLVGGTQIVKSSGGDLRRLSTGTLILDERGKSVWGAILSRKYSDNQKALYKYEKSAEMPDIVREAVKSFDQILSTDVILLIDVLNEKTQQDPKNLFLDDDPNNPAYFGAASNAYWNRFAPLRPAADKIVDSGRAYLKVE